jgi:hypothetical protein
MKIFLAGQNGIHGIIGGALNDSVFSGWVSGNLKPAWQKTAKRTDTSLKAFTEELQNENFWQGGSRGIGYTRLRP